ncbi:MAG TPA: hypothetical protein VF272_01935 [Candidatus Saccharimonadia bacterium]
MMYSTNARRITVAEATARKALLTGRPLEISGWHIRVTGITVDPVGKRAVGYIGDRRQMTCAVPIAG